MSSNFIQRSRHGTVFYFRRRVPKDLVSRIGRSHLVSSLHTEELAEARKRGRALAAATDELFNEHLRALEFPQFSGHYAKPT